MQKLILLALSGCLTSLLPSGTASFRTTHPSWMTLDEAAASLKKEKRPVLMDLYTDWCGWCKVMDKKTYSKEAVVEYLQRKFYVVKVNAESRDAMLWEGRRFEYNAGYRVNEFALWLTQGRLEFPTTVILPSDGTGPQAIPGYLEAKDLELVVKYFGEGAYGKVPFADYQKSFKASW